MLTITFEPGSAEPFIVGVLSFVRPPLLRSISSTIGLPFASTPLPTLSVIESIVVPVGGS